MNDIKETYQTDLQEKKRTARSASKKARRGGRVQTPADLLTGKERREYEGTSPVTVSSIFDHIDHIISLEDFKKLKTRREKTLALYELKKRYTARQIAEVWGTSLKLIYYYYNAYGVAGKKDVPEMVDAPSVDAKPRKKKAKAKPIASVALPQSSECSFTAVGQYSAPSLARKLQGLAHTLNDGQLYKVEIHVTELTH